MCGVAGIIVPPGVDLERMRHALARMQSAQKHRGPDDQGMYWNERTRTGLAANRLAIRDLSSAGHMPMCVDDVCITYNGEIYNAQELRARLTADGTQFFSHTDTEVILRGYLRWGVEVVRQLRGMFAFAIHDARRNTLLLARDPLGIKPLYYARGAPFCFASELRALRAAGLIGRELDARALSAFLQLGSVPAPLTIFRDAVSALPGHYLQLDLQGASAPELTRYWEWPEGTNDARVQDTASALDDAVRVHLVSDVPVGAFLSGGLDSSSVVALAAPHTHEPLRTCSIAFASAQHDESGYARAVASALGTVHHSRLVTSDDFHRNMPAFVQAMDQPTIDGFNTFFAAQTAADIGLKVVLSGLGGDELFGGYPSFRGVPRVLRTIRSLRAFAGSHASSAIDALASADRWRKVAEATRRPTSPASAFLVYRGLFTRAEVERMLPAATHFDAVQHVQQGAGRATSDLGSWVARAELATYTSNQLLRDTDAMSMVHSLEVRVPLLDARLLHSVLALPASQRLGGTGSKPLLRRLMAQRLPAVALRTRARQGFTFPMVNWLGDARRETLWRWDAPVFEAFDRRELEHVQRRFRAGRAHWSRAWAFIALNEWSRRVAHA